MYQYTPLAEDDSIRIIELQPSRDKAAMVRCELVHTALCQAQEDIIDHYTALSYVWDDANDRATIEVGGKTIEVTKSLWTALLHLRDERRVLNLWADGICINQSDYYEKAQQVQQMGKIYESPHHTDIFLGECDAASENTVATAFDDPTANKTTLLNAFGLISVKPWFYKV